MEFPKTPRKGSIAFITGKLSAIRLFNFFLVLLIGSLCSVTSLEFRIQDSRVSEVSITGSNAEITRLFSLHDIQLGRHTLVIDDLPTKTVDENSISIKGIGAAEILGTVIQRRTVRKEEMLSYISVKERLVALHTAATAQAATMEQEKAAVKQRLASLAQYVHAAFTTTTAATASGASGGAAVSPPSLEHVEQILSFQEKETARANEKLVLIDAKLKETNDIITTLAQMVKTLQTAGLYKNLFPLTTSPTSTPATSSNGNGDAGGQPPGTTEVGYAVQALSREERTWAHSESMRELHVHINVIPPAVSSSSADGIGARTSSTGGSDQIVKTLQFEMHYTASPASWHPEYDLRLDSHASVSDASATTTITTTATTSTTTTSTVAATDKQAFPVVVGQRSLTVRMHANVEQSTMEDWTDVRLHLSTASPSYHIYAPRAVRKSVSYRQYKPAVMRRERNSYSGKKMKMMSRAAAPEPMMAMASAGASAEAGEPEMMADAIEEEALNDDNEEEKDMMMMEMSMTGASMSTGGTLGAAVVFTPPFAVNISSNTRSSSTTSSRQQQSRGRSSSATTTAVGVGVAGGADFLNSGSGVTSATTRLYVESMKLEDPYVFSYIVPGQSSAAHLKAWRRGTPTATATDKNKSGNKAAARSNKGNTDINADAVLSIEGEGEGKGQDMPLLASGAARVFVDDTYTGSTSTKATAATGTFRFNLGDDRNIEFTSNYVLPSKSSKEEDHSTWFVTDKTKYHVENVEYSYTVTSHHTEPHLVVLSEYVPHVQDSEIKVEVSKPAPESLVNLHPSSSSSSSTASTTNTAGEIYTEEEFIAKILAHPELQSPPSATTKNAATKSSSSKVYTFFAKGSLNLVTAKWLMPEESMQAGIKYRIVWPDGKTIHKNWQDHSTRSSSNSN